MSRFYGLDSTTAVTKEDLRHIGEEAIAYIRELSASDFETLYPGILVGDAPYTLYALLGADGEPLMISDDRSIAEANASEHDLEMVSLH
ncbi:MAG: DUF1150 family protein [Rhizobiales bacterium]|nr:DUF1150 family protein [Hyphomicrobiales bacterium]